MYLNFQPFWWSPVTALTDMCEVLRLLYSGYTNAEIADEMQIQENTIQKHMQNIFRKMNVSSKWELLRLKENE